MYFNDLTNLGQDGHAKMHAGKRLPAAVFNHRRPGAQTGIAMKETIELAARVPAELDGERLDQAAARFLDDEIGKCEPLGPARLARQAGIHLGVCHAPVSEPLPSDAVLIDFLKG